MKYIVFHYENTFDLKKDVFECKKSINDRKGTLIMI